MEGMITLTIKEQRLNDIIISFMNKDINISTASRLTGLSERQIYRKQASYKLKGIKSIPHALKLNPSKQGFEKSLKDKILYLYENEYNGWNFHHFNDTLEDHYNIKVSDSFIYKLLTFNDYSSPYKYKKKKESHPPRERREKAGELIQVDASKHKWFYGIDEYQHLHGAIDDATGIVTSCFFHKEETIFGYQMLMKKMMINYGIPECLYTDFRTVFKSNKKELTLEEEIEGKTIKNTKFHNMLEHLGTDIISTINPRAKGRIERLWRTFQDRLYKELKKNNINNIEEANEFLDKVFIPKYNTRFALPIDSNKNVFICLDEIFNYNKELAIFSEHKVYHNSYLKYNNKYHIILDNEEKTYIPTKEKVRVYTFLDGTEHVLFKDKYYNLKPVTEFKINSVVVKEEAIITKTDKRIGNKTDSPWRKGWPKEVNRKVSQWSYFNAC